MKVSQTRNNNGQFSVQVTAEAPLQPLRPNQATKDLNGEILSVDRVSVGLQAELADRSGDLAQFVRGVLALKAKDSQTALEAFEGLYDRHPKSQLVGAALANLYLNRVRYLPQDAQMSRAYEILSQVALIDNAYNLENRLALALLLNKAKQTRSALELLNKILESNPGYCDALHSRLALANQDGLHDVRQKTLELIADLGPENRWGQRLALEEARQEGDLAKTRSLLQNLSKLAPWEGFIAQLNNMDENYRAAIEDLSKRRAIFMDRDYYPYSISQAHGKLGERDAQRQWLEKTLAINPGHREALLDMVNLDCLDGDTDSARQRLNAYLRVEPGDAFFRQRLNHLEGATAFESYRVDTNAVIEQAKNKPISEGADSELLLDQLMVRLFPDGSQMRYTHLVTRVLTKKGVDEESELRLPEDLEILELRTIKADGSVFYPEDFEHKSSISLSGIGVGDFIDEEHIEYLPPAYYDEDGLDGEMTFIFQGIDRIYHHSELVLIYPEDLQPEPVLLSRNMPVEPEIEARNGLKYVRWITRNLPPMTLEPNMPSRAWIQPTATFYYNTTWEEIRDFYANAIGTRLGLSQRLLRQVETWKNLEPDLEKRARRVYKEVADRIEPGSNFYQNVNLVWETKSGNGTLLLLAIYRALGFDCDLVFVRPVEVEKLILDTPMPNYTYALLKLNLNGETHWLDPNHKGLAFGYVPYPYRGARGLVCDSGEPLYVDVPAFEDVTERTETAYSMYFREDGSLAGLGSERFFGLFASQLSRRYDSLNNPEIKQQVEAGMNQTYPGAVVSRVEVTQDLPRGEFELTNDFSHPGLGKTDGGVMELSFPLPKTPILEHYGTMAERTTPVRIPAPHYNVAKLVLSAPEGYRWEAPPEDRQIKSEYGSYHLKLNLQEDRKLEIERTYHLPAQYVEPVHYQEFLEFCKAMIDNEDITFRAIKQSGQP